MSTFDRRYLDAFQIEDIAKLAMKRRGMLNWEQGMGKTIGSMLFAKALKAKRVLIIAPQDIVRQWQETAREKFVTDLRPIACAADAVKVRQRIRAGLTGWYITWYEAMSQAGKMEETSHVNWLQSQDEKGRTVFRAATVSPIGKRVEVSLDSCPVCGMTQSPDRFPFGPWMRDVIARQRRNTTKWLLENRNVWKKMPTRQVSWQLEIRPGANCPRIVKAFCTRCGYTHMSKRLKPAYYWLRDLFDVIIVDEGTKIKNMGSQTAKAIHGIRAKDRQHLLLTGTPIKNYVADMSGLLLWTFGPNSPQYPYAHKDGQEKFEKDFCVEECILDQRGAVARRKILPQISNLVSFWRLTNAGCVRRTKANAGVKIVPAVWHDLRAPFGAMQAAAYEKWLRGFSLWFCHKHPDSPISKYPELVDRNAAILGQFAKLQFICTLPEAEPDNWAAPVSNYTPKNVAVIRKAAELVDSGRKVVIFSAVKEHSLWMAKVLNGLRYPALSIVEERGDEIVTLGPQGRADLVKDFIQDGFPILCASIHAMNLGHNLDCASAVIVNGLPWDFATFDQAIARVHRITSKRSVDIYVAQTVCREDTDDFRQGASLDQKMRRLLRDKGGCAALALDGKLRDEVEVREDQQQFLEELVKAWKTPVNVADERDLQDSLKQLIGESAA